MWDTTNLDLRGARSPKSCRFTAVVSHISRKTSEMWGTRRLVRPKDCPCGGGESLELVNALTNGQVRAHGGCGSCRGRPGMRHEGAAAKSRRIGGARRTHLVLLWAGLQDKVRGEPSQIRRLRSANHHKLSTY